MTTIEKGGIFINSKKVTNPGHLFDNNDILSNNLTAIRIGKSNN